MSQMKEAGPVNQGTASFIENVLPNTKINFAKLNSWLQFSSVVQ